MSYTSRPRSIVGETGSTTEKSGSIEGQTTNDSGSAADGPFDGEPTVVQRPVDRAVTQCLETTPDEITGTDSFGLDSPGSSTNTRLNLQTETRLAELVSPGPKLHETVVGQLSVRATTSQVEGAPPTTYLPYDLGREQLKDPKVKLWIEYLTDCSLPREENQARKIVLQSS